MAAMASQITNLTIVYSTVCLGVEFMVTVKYHHRRELLHWEISGISMPIYSYCKNKSGSFDRVTASEATLKDTDKRLTGIQGS